MNWEELLRKYIAHVVACEGTDFLTGRPPEPEFTAEEWAELQRLAGRP